MKSKRQEVQLYTDPALYPWQVVEGDGETWILMRQKIKVVNKEIVQIQDVFLEDFSWEVLIKEKERSLYKGVIKLGVFCQLQAIEKEYDGVLHISSEESCSRELFLKDERIRSKERQEENEENQFSSLLLEALSTKQKEETGEEKENLYLQYHWQAWLKGVGNTEEVPKIVKVHAAQIGLKTVLVEVLVNLRKANNNNEIDKLLQKEVSDNFSLVREEIIFHIDDDIQEVVGICSQRGFYRCLVEQLAREIIISDLNYFTIFYVSPHKGAERLLLASGTLAERIRMASKTLPQVTPVHYEIRNKWVNPLLMDKNRIMTKNEYLMLINHEVINIEQKSDQAQVIPLLPKLVVRNKPGEKYMKKNQKKVSQQQNSTYSISFTKF